MLSKLPLSIPVKKTLRKLGNDIRSARIRRRVTMALMAERAAMSRTTLTKIEKGDPSVSFGAYATVIYILGLLPNLGSLAEISRDALGRELEEENLPKTCASSFSFPRINLKRKFQMNQIRWGLCCQFRDAPIRYRSTTVTYIERLKANQKDYLQFLDKMILDNLKTLFNSIHYCSEHKIGSFRITSDLLPIYSHVQHGYQLQQMPSAIEIFQEFSNCKELAKEKKIRLSFHPSQFVVLNSPHPHVVENSIRELEYHGQMAKLLGADVINIHVGGVYGNKSLALKRFAKSFKQLSQHVKEHLTIENDDTSYTPEDLLPICYQLRIPLVYDVHHHRCLPDSLTIEDASDLAYNTWNREPLFHISSPLGGWQEKNPQRHHDFIDLKDFPLYWLKFPRLTVEVEAKAKEVAILKLMQELKNYLDIHN